MTLQGAFDRRTSSPVGDGQEVLDVTHWTDRLFSFRIARPASFRFRSGEFVMIGLPDEGSGRPILRAYSIASPAWDDTLEFYSIKVPDGRLTSRLQDIRPGDRVILRPKPVGTLVLDALRPGKRLWLFATGTGIAPFASILRDPDVYDRFSSVILCHTCRHRPDLAYGEQLVRDLGANGDFAELIGGSPRDRLFYCPSTTSGDSQFTGRITERFASGALFDETGVRDFDAGTDRAMICGSLGFNGDMTLLLESAGLMEGANSAPGDFVVEKAFVEAR